MYKYNRSGGEWDKKSKGFFVILVFSVNVLLFFFNFHFVEELRFHAMQIMQSLLENIICVFFLLTSDSDPTFKC